MLEEEVHKTYSKYLRQHKSKSILEVEMLEKIYEY